MASVDQSPDGERQAPPANGVYISTRDIYERVEAMASKVEVLLAMGTAHNAEHDADAKRQDAQDARLNVHGDRIGTLEKWKAAVPAAIGLAMTALIVKAITG